MIMKITRCILLIISICILSVFRLFAQNGLEDVVYLKNGNIYRGLIIEQVPNISIKIQIAGGNVFAVNLSDIAKITKEQKTGYSSTYQEDSHWGYHHWHHRDSTQGTFKPGRRGYFFQSQLLIENMQGGVRIINGYRFNRFVSLGIGIGADYVFSSPLPGLINNLDKSEYAGVYLPLYLYLSGDMSRKRITPFYAIEAGYAMYHGNADNFSMSFGNNMQGGPMGGLGLGVRFYTHSRVNFSLLANLNFKDVHLTEVNTYYTPSGSAYTVSQNIETLLVFPGIRFGVGF
jgi:hypothetical protein